MDLTKIFLISYWFKNNLLTTFFNFYDNTVGRWEKLYINSTIIFEV